MDKDKRIRTARLRKDVSLVTCGNLILRDKNKDYPETMWKVEGTFDDLIKRGFLVETRSQTTQKK